MRPAIRIDRPATAIGSIARAGLAQGDRAVTGALVEGQRHLRADRSAAAEAVLREALAAAPDHPDVNNLLGVALGRLGRPEEGEAAIRSALRVNRRDPGIWLNLGNRLHEQGRAGEAAEAFAEAIRLGDRKPASRAALMRALDEAGHRDEAADAAEALVAAADDAAMLVDAVEVLASANRASEAAEVLERALAIEPEQTDWWMRLAMLRHAAQRLQDAAEACERVIALEPGRGAAWTVLASCRFYQRDFAAMEEVLDRAPAEPAEAANRANLRGMMLVAQAKIEEGLEAMALTADLAPDAATLQMTRLMYLNYDAVRSTVEIADEHRRFGQRFSRSVPSVALRDTGRDPDRTLRVGFLSPDLRLHSVAYFLAPLLKSLDRDRVLPVAYANVKRPDQVTAQLRAETALWRDTAHLDDRTLAEQIAADDIDILIELAGLTRDSRLMVCTARPAPIQISWLGYPNTTGLPQMDYRITDWIADPDGAEDHYSEILIRLPRCFLCYAVPEQAPPVAAPPVTESGSITFGSFNNLAKVNGRVVEVWAEVLRAVPGSRLLMKATGTGDPATQEHLRRSFAAQGVDDDRIHFADYAPTPRDHLRTYDQVDIALDTFPYNGTTTICEALWMGVPVVTLEGDRHASRVTASLLSSIGFDAGITRSRDEFVRTAVLLAENPELLATARRHLRSDLARSPLTDHRGFARTFEDALRAVWQMHCAGERPPR